MLLNMTKRMTGTMWQQLQECASSLSACKNDLVGCKGKKRLFNVWFCRKCKYPGDECYTNTIIQYVSLILYKEVIHKQHSCLGHCDIYS